ncbi:MAG: hypothetical protein HXX17_10430 [Geobacteraceae bacterium]|nr:hypothetical protein [Geobacteraceae bacterium]
MIRKICEFKQIVKQYSLLSIVLLVTFMAAISIVMIYYLPLNSPPIRSDGVGYYLYLPATFIYNDLSLHRIANEIFGGAIPDWTGASLSEGANNYLIKYPAGTALLMMPFFFIACVIAYLSGIPVDGFNWPFQCMAAFSGLFYCIAGIAALHKVLERHFRQSTIAFVILVLVFGTNLFHYATYDNIFSHTYSFFLFSAFLYCIQFVYSTNSVKYYACAGLVAGLIVITRPTNALWLIFGICYGINSLRDVKDRLSLWFTQKAKILIAATLFASIIALQLIYWKIVTGNFIVYSYRGEYFNFAHPAIFNVLFSVRKGLFFWSPILLTVFPGIYFTRVKTREFFIPVVLFLPINIFVISSWYCWYYGGSFGHRAFTESLPLFAICFCSLYEGLQSLLYKKILVIFSLFCVALSIWLMIKYWTGIIPFDETTWEIFTAAFF